MKKPVIEEDLEEFFEDNGMNAMSPMIELLKVQYETALGLTKLILKHRGEEEINKDYIFKVFKEASKFINTEMNKEP